MDLVKSNNIETCLIPQQHKSILRTSNVEQLIISNDLKMQISSSTLAQLDKQLFLL